MLTKFEDFNEGIKHWFNKPKKDKKYDSIKFILEIENLLIECRNKFDSFMKNGQGSLPFLKFQNSVKKVIDVLELMDNNSEGRTRYYIDRLGVIMSDFDVKSFTDKNIKRDYMIKFNDLIRKYGIKKLSNGWGPDFPIASRTRRYSD